MMFLCRRRDGLDHAGYAEYLLGSHAPLAMEHMIDMRGYVLNVVDDAPELDSINALMFETADDFAHQRFSSEEGQRMLEEDHPRFLGSADGYATREITVQACSPDAIKYICAVERIDTLTHDAFVDTWLHTHAPAIAQETAGLVTNVVDRNLYGTGGDWDCFIEWYCDAGSDATELLHNLRPLAKQTALYRVTEHRLKSSSA